MSIDEEYAALFETCDTYEQLVAEVKALYARHGYTDPRIVNSSIRGLFGGTTAYTGPDGQYTDWRRRKFLGRADRVS